VGLDPVACACCDVEHPAPADGHGWPAPASAPAALHRADLFIYFSIMLLNVALLKLLVERRILLIVHALIIFYKGLKYLPGRPPYSPRCISRDCCRISRRSCR
jgi:hypothetical protein